VLVELRGDDAHVDLADVEAGMPVNAGCGALGAADEQFKGEGVGGHRADGEQDVVRVRRERVDGLAVARVDICNSSLVGRVDQTLEERDALVRTYTMWPGRRPRLMVRRPFGSYERGRTPNGLS
jgi:hypothetical protein